MKEEIKKIIEELFKKANLQIDIEEIEEKEKRIFIKIRTEEPEILNYEKERVVFDFQHILAVLIRKKSEVGILVDLDINNYKKEKEKRLEEVAVLVADSVSSTKKEKSLPLMTPYERRIVHLKLSERKDIKTRSEGEGVERRIIISIKN